MAQTHCYYGVRLLGGCLLSVLMVEHMFANPSGKRGLVNTHSIAGYLMGIGVRLHRLRNTGVAHVDASIGNVLLDEGCCPQLCDLGTPRSLQFQAGCLFVATRYCRALA